MALMELIYVATFLVGSAAGLVAGYFLKTIEIEKSKTKSKNNFPWTEKKGVIYLPSFTSDGTTGSQWIARLEKAGHHVSDYAKSILNSPNFKPTTGVPYNTVVLKGELWSDVHRTTKQIRTDVQLGTFMDGKPLFTPNPELACWLRLLYTNEQLKQMGLVWIITMHEPINDSDGGPGLLDMNRVDGDSWLSAYYGGPGLQWPRESGFALSVSQVSSPQN